ncbi:MAG: AAA family ATPase [Elusimicrobiota bacterium]|jgi:ATP-dependent exoDNAse (exonuclease V) alpha subunit|nr:AAA family ATPase [Elusimicrobiota bacterium]
MKIEINEEFKEALDLIAQTNICVFVTGRAGTGKTTFLRYYMTQVSKKTVVLAPTGVAALNAGGETIHSFFKFSPAVTVSKIKNKNLGGGSIYKKVETIIIDEASMLRCDLLDCMDKFLRLNRQKHREPFGGVQIVFIGDLCQLPPVVRQEERDVFSTVYESPFFLHARVLSNCMMRTVELKKIYRQSDPEFIYILNSVRNKTIDDASIRKLNRQVAKSLPEQDMRIYLTTTNKRAASINEQYLSKIKEKAFEFNAVTEKVSPTEKENAFPAEQTLIVKKGAQVMMLNNDAAGRWVNGSIGIVTDIIKDKKGEKSSICVRFPSGRIEKAEPFVWELFKYKWNDKDQQIETESAGFFRQYPLKLSWAVTIHKSQGKTFDNVVIDMERGAFAPGQLYVALSRCSTLEGISLMRPLSRRDIL